MFPFRAMSWWFATTFTFLLVLAVSQSDLSLAAASAAVVAAAAVLVGRGGRVRLTAVAQTTAGLLTLRDHTHRTVFIPQCDPDAAGRPRPRAPGRREHR